MSWSSGKDSALALASAREAGEVEVVGLLTTINVAADRVVMHAVRRELLLAQADRLGLPLTIVELPASCPYDLYAAKMRDAFAAAADAGVEAMVFGDLFLEDVRADRERALSGTGIAPVFPLWGRPTDELARTMVEVGIRAVLTCVDPSLVPAELAGRSFDGDLLAALPPSVDPCGERGEFHTFVWDGPGFSSPIPVEVGEVVARDGFVFADVVQLRTTS